MSRRRAQGRTATSPSAVSLFLALVSIVRVDTVDIVDVVDIGCRLFPVWLQALCRTR